MEKLLGILESIKPQVDFKKEQRLIDDDLLDSFDIVVLVGMLNDEFGVNIPIGKLKPEHLNSLESIQQLINDQKARKKL